MPVFVIKKEHENNDKLISRFKKGFFGSRISPTLRKRIRFAQDPCKYKVRAGAIKRSYYRAQRSKAEILGN